jgi:hypothetical protein
MKWIIQILVHVTKLQSNNLTAHFPKVSNIIKIEGSWKIKTLTSCELFQKDVLERGMI